MQKLCKQVFPLSRHTGLAPFAFSCKFSGSPLLLLLLLYTPFPRQAGFMQSSETPLFSPKQNASRQTLARPLGRELRTAGKQKKNRLFEKIPSARINPLQLAEICGKCCFVPCNKSICTFLCIVPDTVCLQAMVVFYLILNGGNTRMLTRVITP